MHSSKTVLLLLAALLFVSAQATSFYSTGKLKTIKELNWILPVACCVSEPITWELSGSLLSSRLQKDSFEPVDSHLS